MPIESLPILRPDWPVDAVAGAFMTTRHGGFSSGCYGAGPAPAAAHPVRAGDHVGDDAALVARNRAAVVALLPAEPLWLEQVHGVTVVDADAQPPRSASPDAAAVTADAAVSSQAARPLVIMTADCLPVLFVDAQAGVIGAAHAGWRGLAAGVLENTVAAMQGKGAQTPRIHVWLGAAIGPQAFETGAEVRDAFAAIHAADAAAFQPVATRPGKWMGNLYQLARWRLQRIGVEQVGGGPWCTVQDRRFYSYRRDGVTGRMGSFIWLR